MEEEIVQPKKKNKGGPIASIILTFLDLISVLLTYFLLFSTLKVKQDINENGAVAFALIIVFLLLIVSIIASICLTIPSLATSITGFAKNAGYKRRTIYLITMILSILIAIALCVCIILLFVNFPLSN